MRLIYEDYESHSAYGVKKFDAEKFDRFIDDLGHDFDRYSGDAKALENGYGKYYHNRTYVGKAANASKEFIDRKQFEDFHVESKNVQNELFNRCLGVKSMFESQVDPSPKARIDNETLEQIKREYRGYADKLEYEGYDIECIAREIESEFGEFGNVTQPNFRSAVESYDEFCGTGGFLDKCIMKFEDFNEDARQYMKRSMIKDHSYDLQNRMKATASALEEMKVYEPNVPQNSITLTSLGLNASYLDNGLAALWTAAANGKKLNIKIFASDKEAAQYLDSQMKILCDDDNSNDEAAIANINATLQGFLYEEVVDGKKYVAYDQKKIEGTLKHLEKDGLSHQLLSSVKAQIDANKRKGVAVPDAITKLGIGGKLENTKLEVRKDGAGVRLEVTSNNDLFPLNEIKNRPVAYAATEESAKNYFMNGKDYDWDAIREWYRSKDDFHDNYHATSVEYDFLAYQMKDMSDADIETLTNAAEFNVDKACTAYQLSGKLGILANRHLMDMDIDRATNCIGDDFEKKYARAVLIVNIDENMGKLSSGAGSDRIVNISYSEKEKKYIGDITCLPSLNDPSLSNLVSADMNNQKISVYLYGSALRIDENFDKEVNLTVNKIAPNIGSEGAGFIFDQAVSYSLEHSGLGGANLPVEVVSELTKLKDAYESSVDVQGISQALDYGNNAKCMMIRGVAVHIDGFEEDRYCIYSPDYDDRKLVFSVAAYNEKHGTHYTIADMKSEFEKECSGNSDIFDSYHEWYTDEGEDAREEMYKRLARDKGIDETDAMSVEEIEQYFAG